VAVQHYSLFKGWVVERQFATYKNPHYQIHAQDRTNDYRISVNVYSSLNHSRRKRLSQVEFVLVENFTHPIVARLEELEPGLYPLTKPEERGPGGLALDFVRGNLFDREKMKPVPFNLPGPNNDLNDYLDKYIQQAIGDNESMVCVFGSRWGPESWPDKIFGFKPGYGLHNIHMNQGNLPGMFAGDNGVWQDGGLLIYLAKAKKWAGFFIKFQQQTWDTWDDSGRPKFQKPRHYRYLKKKHKKGERSPETAFLLNN